MIGWAFSLQFNATLLYVINHKKVMKPKNILIVSILGRIALTYIKFNNNSVLLNLRQRDQKMLTIKIQNLVVAYFDLSSIKDIKNTFNIG